MKLGNSCVGIAHEALVNLYSQYKGEITLWEAWGVQAVFSIRKGLEARFRVVVLP